MSRKASSSDPASMSGSNSAKILRVCLLTATYLWKSAALDMTSVSPVHKTWRMHCKRLQCKIRTSIDSSSSSNAGTRLEWTVTRAHKDELRAQSAADEAGHRRAHPVAPRHIVGRGHHPDAAHRHRLVLLHRHSGASNDQSTLTA